MDISNKREVEQLENISPQSHSGSSKQFHQSDSVYGRKLKSPILGHHYRLPDLSKHHASSITLDTSLPHIPVYTHLKVYDLKPIHQSRMPPILSALQLQLPEDIALGKSSREISSAARMSEEDKASASCNVTKL